MAIKFVLLLLLFFCFFSNLVQSRVTRKPTDFDSRQLLFDYEDCLLMFQRKSKNFNTSRRYEYLESCIGILEKIHGKIVPLETIQRVLKSPLNPVDNPELFNKCVIAYPREGSNVSAVVFMDNFVDKVQNLVDNTLGWVPHESLVCYELDRSIRFLCDVREQCAKTDEEKKQAELVYVVGYSLFQLVLGTNKKLDCSSFTSHEDGLWMGQLSDSVWSSPKFSMESQIFENEQFCPEKIYHQRISINNGKAMSAGQSLKEIQHQTIIDLLATF